MNSWVRGIENAPSFQEGMQTFNDYQMNGHKLKSENLNKPITP
jgi:hypothetical protein